MAIKRRSNTEWLADLSDEATQAEALGDLRDYLLRVVYLYLDRHRASIARLGSHGMEQLAEDFVQEALLQIQARLATFRGESKFTTWAYCFVIHIAAAELRRRHWRAQSLDALINEQDAPLSTFISDQETLNPETAAARDQILELIGRMIHEELSDRQRFALLSVHFQGMPIEQVAQQLGSTPNTVYKLIHDARRKLKKGLQGRHYSEADVLALFGKR